jgi:hypothetical protein
MFPFDGPVVPEVYIRRHAPIHPPMIQRLVMWTRW